MEAGAPCPTIITYYVDKSFSMEIKTPPASFFLKKAANIKSGSQTAGKETIAQISSMKIKEIAEAKMKDLNANTVEAAMKIIMGSARSMGIEVKD
jgi:large subunit ribosomal protein L11